MTAVGRDAVIIGGGFYGCCIAEHLARQGWVVSLFEREPELLRRASYNNQARLHGGYHYPRSFSTAFRSRLNMPRFWREFESAIVSDFVKLYAIARHNSKVTPRQFEAFCANIEAPLKPASSGHAQLFNGDLIAAVYEVEEYAFDARRLRDLMIMRLRQTGVRLSTGFEVAAIARIASDRYAVHLADGAVAAASLVINCTYSALNCIDGLPRTRHRLKQEITELALVELPSALTGLGITVMDGPFFSIMPFPDRRAATLTHVRYTPHGFWLEDESNRPNPNTALAEGIYESRLRFMVTDAARFIPSVREVRQIGSLFETKTILEKNELDDGRPILLEALGDDPRLLAVLGGKIDNIYDILSALDEHVGLLGNG